MIGALHFISELRIDSARKTSCSWRRRSDKHPLTSVFIELNFSERHSLAGTTCLSDEPDIFNPDVLPVFTLMGCFPKLCMFHSAHIVLQLQEFVYIIKIQQ